MQSAIQQFRENIERVRVIGGLYEALGHLTTPAVDAGDLLRTQIVMAVSALTTISMRLQGLECLKCTPDNAR